MQSEIHCISLMLGRLPVFFEVIIPGDVAVNLFVGISHGLYHEEGLVFAGSPILVSLVSTAQCFPLASPLDSLSSL